MWQPNRAEYGNDDLGYAVAMNQWGENAFRNGELMPVEQRKEIKVVVVAEIEVPIKTLEEVYREYGVQTRNRIGI